MLGLGFRMIFFGFYSTKIRMVSKGDEVHSARQLAEKTSF
jgi:hypothetical protein